MLLLPFTSYTLTLTRRASGATSCPYTTLFRSQIHRGECLQGLRTRSLRTNPRHEQRELDVLNGAQDRQQVVDLEDEAHRSEEHTSEIQTPCNLVCSLLLETKNSIKKIHICRRV